MEINIGVPSWADARNRLGVTCEYRPGGAGRSVLARGMRAAGVTEFGGPEALQIVDVPDEPLGPGEVRLRVAAATVNPTDTHARAGAYAERDPVKQPPWVPGMDVAGEVVEVGEGVDHVAPSGTRVMGIVVPTGAHGGYREDLVLPGDSVVPCAGRCRRGRGLDAADERASPRGSPSTSWRCSRGRCWRSPARPARSAATSSSWPRPTG